MAEALKKLSGFADKLSEEVNYLISEEQNGDLSFENVKSTLMEDTESTKLYLGQELDDAKQTMKDYPTLIYDGPFSDSVINLSYPLIIRFIL